MCGEYEFVSETIDEYGVEYVERLVNQGYAPVLTNIGWRWLLIVDKYGNRRTSDNRTSHLTPA
jgi:hypothetical protein